MVDKELARAFICIDLPDSIKENISSSMDKLDRHEFRTVKNSSMHITLFFLGNIDKHQQELVCAAIEKRVQKGFFVSVKGVGVFSPSRPNVVFAKIDDGAKELLDIHDLLLSAIESAGIEIEQRKYAPHITIARAKERLGKLSVGDFLKENSEKEFGEFMCDSIKLKRSVLTSDGPVYEDIYVKRLQRAEK